MGWTTYRATKQQAIDDVLGQVAERNEILASRCTGKCLWYLAKHHQIGTTWIGLSLIEMKNGEAAIKDMDETAGPYYYDCPLSYLDRADPPRGTNAAEWREKVRAFHAKRAEKKAGIKPGTRVEYGGSTYELAESLGRKGWSVWSLNVDGGRVCRLRMKSNQLSAATVVTAAT